MHRFLGALSVAAALLVAGLPAHAAHHSVKDDVLSMLDGIEKKLVDLAGATPQAKLSWRPAEGVRSTSEVFMHLAGANYFIAGMLGAPPAADMKGRNLEKEVTKQADIIAELKKSFEYARTAVNGVSEEDLGAAIKMFGQDATKRKAMITLVEHASEHLGQSIAYARMNSITPPWSK
jgi:uncharacterized damage-inducible protein DinB